MKSKLLERLSKEKPENTKDEVEETLRRGYSLEQIIKAMAPEVINEPRQGKICYQSNARRFEIPYTYESFRLLCRLMF
ncbi:MAG: hypothetical protein IJQ08_06995 [Synergistaceae bacterium]|nr:hypothetical protein [Synergistaceae bacterium]